MASRQLTFTSDDVIDVIGMIQAGWVGELRAPISYGVEVTGFAQDDTGVDVALSDGQSPRADYLVGCAGGRSLIRNAAAIELPGGIRPAAT